MPWHRDIVDARDHGLRNINLTAMTMLNLFNRLKTISYQYDYENDRQFPRLDAKGLGGVLFLISIPKKSVLEDITISI